MDFNKEFSRIMKESKFLSLASSKNDMPSVRIINFVFNPEKKVILFATIKGSPKTQDFEINEKVSFITHGDQNCAPEFVRPVNATIKKSALSIADATPIIVEKYPEMQSMLAHMGQMMEVYEIHFSEAKITVGMGNDGKVIL